MNDQELDAILKSWEAPSPSPALREAVRQGIPPAHHKRSYGWMAAAASLFAAACLFGIASMGSGQARLADGTYVKTSLQIEPPSARRQMSRADHVLSIHGSRQRGYFYDPATLTYTGYELTVQPTGPGTYLTTVQPAAKPFSQVSTQAGADQYRQVPLQVLTAARVVKDGEPFEILLAVQPDGTRVSERIQLSHGSPHGLLGDFALALRAHHDLFIHWIHGLLNGQ